ncbi:Xylose isomerase-like TIM barrel [Chlamydia abortus]|nr:Xylose isomerase-like TIM barrel [Chlamydia abortus]
MIIGYRVRRRELTEPLLEQLVRSGFRHLEWDWKWDGNSKSPVPSTKELMYAKDICSQYGLTISIAGPNGLSIAEKVMPLRQVSLQLWKELYQASEYLKAKWLVMELGSAGFKSGNSSKKRDRVGIAKGVIGEIVQAVDDGPLLLLENQRRLPEASQKCYLGDDANDLLYCLEALPEDRSGVIFDTGHALIEQVPEHTLRVLCSSIKAFHLHCNDGVTDNHHSLTQVDIDANKSYWESVIDMIHTGVPAVLEIEPLSEALLTKRLIDEYRSE